MRSIQELAAAGNITDTATTQIDEFQDTIFSKDVHKYMEDFRFLQNAVDHDTELVGSLGASKRLFITTSHLDITTAHTEGAERTYTEMTNLDSIDATPAWKLGAIAISKEIATTCSVQLVELAKYMIAQSAEKNIEAAIVTEIETATTNTVYGGDATTYQTLETGDTMTPTLAIKARGAIRKYDGEAKFLFIAAEQEEQLILDTQFRNASEYGTDKIVLNGEIGTFVGMRVIVTSNVNAKTNGEHSWGVDGHLCFALGQHKQSGQNACTLVWKAKPTFDYEYLKRFCNHYIYSDAAYDAELTQEKLIAKIFVTDA